MAAVQVQQEDDSVAAAQMVPVEWSDTVLRHEAPVKDFSHRELQSVTYD
jgi:hypothetical protein